MAKHSNQKPKLLYLSKILLEQTDEQHAMLLSEIISELEKYGVSAGRKSLYDDFEALRVFGLDVCTKRDRYVRYYIKDNRLELAELRLISDGLSACRLVGKRQRRELLKRYAKSERILNTSALISDSFEDEEDESSADICKNLSLVCTAINDNKKITFKSFEWNCKKQRILHNGGELITLSPWVLYFEDGEYKLAAFDSLHKNVHIALISRMVSLTVTGSAREGENETLDYFRRIRLGRNLRLRCDNALADSLLGRFGTDVTVLTNRENYFEVSLKTRVDESFFAWVFSACGGVRIIAPVDVANEYAERIAEISQSLAED